MNLKKVIALGSALVIGISGIHNTMASKDGFVESNLYVLTEGSLSDVKNSGNIIYVKNATGSRGDGSRENPYDDFKVAYNSAGENDTIVLLNSIPIQNDDNNLDSGVFTFGKSVKIVGEEGGELISRVPIQLGADISFEKIEFAVNGDIYLNGHSLTMVEVKSSTSSTAPPPTIYGGFDGLGANSGAKSGLIITGFKTSPFEVKAIYSGSKTGESNVDVELNLMSGIKVEEFISASGVKGNVNADVKITVGDISVNKFVNDKKTEKTHIIFKGYVNSDGVKLTDFKDVELINNASIKAQQDEFSKMVTLKMDANSKLKIEDLSEDFEVEDFIGQEGATIFIGKSGMMKVKNRLSGVVEIRTPGLDTATSGPVEEGHTYVSASSGSDGRIIFKSYFTQPNLDLIKNDDGNRVTWTIGEKASPEPPIDERVEVTVNYVKGSEKVGSVTFESETNTKYTNQELFEMGEGLEAYEVEKPNEVKEVGDKNITFDVEVREKASPEPPVDERVEVTVNYVKGSEKVGSVTFESETNTKYTNQELFEMGEGLEAYEVEKPNEVKEVGDKNITFDVEVREKASPEPPVDERVEVTVNYVKGSEKVGSVTFESETNTNYTNQELFEMGEGLEAYEVEKPNEVKVVGDKNITFDVEVREKASPEPPIDERVEVTVNYVKGSEKVGSVTFESETNTNYTNQELFEMGEGLEAYEVEKPNEVKVVGDKNITFDVEVREKTSPEPPIDERVEVTVNFIKDGRVIRVFNFKSNKKYSYSDVDLYRLSGLRGYELVNPWKNNLVEDKSITFNVELQNLSIYYPDYEREPLVKKTFKENIKEDKPDKKIEFHNMNKAYVKGYSDGTFRPENKIKRAEAVAMLVRLKGYSLTDDRLVYRDTDGWYNKEIYVAYSNNLLDEEISDDFRPDVYMTRGEFANLVNHVIEKNVLEDSKFSDISGHKYEHAINNIFSAGLILGYPDGTFKPNDEITRAEVVTILNRLGVRKSIYNNYIIEFKDVKKTHWAYYDIMSAANDVL